MKFSVGVEVGDKCTIRAMDCGRGGVRGELRKAVRGRAGAER